MRQALGKTGRRLPRYRPGQTEEAQRQIAKAVIEEPAEHTPTGTAGGDKRQLRGIPVVGSTTGTIPGTDPLQALLDTEPDEPRPQRQPLDKWLRGWIIDRDNATCQQCGLECWPHEIHVDHITPVARGGTNEPDNLRVTCSTCNLRKGSKTPTDPPPILTRRRRRPRHTEVRRWKHVG